jgi:hypothetical protein
MLYQLSHSGNLHASGAMLGSQLLLLLPPPLLLPFHGVPFVLLQPQHFDDRVGPLGLCAAVVAALFAILVVSLIDFLEFISTADKPDGPPAPSPALALPYAGVSRLVEMAGGVPRSVMPF